MSQDARILGTAARNVTVGVAYASTAKLGLMFGAVSGFATLLWAPSGISLAALLLFGNRLAPGIFLGALVVNIWTGAPVVVAIGIAVGNTAEAMLGAWAMRRLAGFEGSFERLSHVIGLLVPAAMISTLVSATVGVASLALGGVVQPHRVLETWRAWWVGDMLGDLVVAPLLLTWASAPSVELKPLRFLEAIALFAAVTMACLAVFVFRQGAATYPFESTFILFPLLAWAALRFELRGAATATALASALAIWGTLRGVGPFARANLADSLLGLQTFMGSAAFTPLVVGGAISDRARAIRTREIFVATVSHDLKGPISVIEMSAASLAAELPAEAGGQAAQNHYQLVHRSVNRMIRLIGDLLDAAAIDAGRMSIEPREESARVLVTEVVDLLGPLVAAKKQDLQVATVEDLQVMCDHARVIQVLSNLIGNAIKFSEVGRPIKLGVELAGGAVRFSVEDKGAGIAREELPHVFERYWHAKPTMGGGTGLGLFVAKGIVEAHGGKLWAESTVGVGSTFHFTLPLAAGHGRSSGAAQGASP
jgi:signal transduction histidine kinase